MCLLLAAHRVHPRFDLAIAANRDERHARPSRPMHRWTSPQGMLAGRDETAGGTWLGVDSQGRFAAVTNFHESLAPRPDPPSRGQLVTRFLQGEHDAAGYARALAAEAPAYAGFNLLLADGEALWYVSNRAPEFARALPPGLYGLSNHLLDTPWPKVERARAELAAWVDRGASDTAPLRALLDAPFIHGEDFGTRCATWLTRDSGGLRVAEENFTPAARSLGVTRFTLGPG